MPGRYLRRIIAIALLALSVVGTGYGAVDADVRQIWQMLDYLAVDYAGAVTDGSVRNESEYREMREFAATARERIAHLPAQEQQAALLGKARSLEGAIATRKSPDAVAELAHDLANNLLLAYPVPAAPSRPPDLARGAALYEAQCVACHGAHGDGDGPAAKTLKPPPIAFTATDRARARSLFSLYQTISLGVPGTSMAPFASLSDADRWALAFYVAGFSSSPAERQNGARLWKEDAALRSRFSTLEALTRAREIDLSAQLGAQRAHEVLAFLRAQPTAAHGDGLNLARARLNESVQAYEKGDAAGAGRLALSAYLDGFEPIEPQLAAQNSELLSRVESAMAEYRARITRRAAPSQVAAQAEVLRELFDSTEATLGRSSADAGAAFLGSFTIFVREGLEALLIVVAMLAFLAQAGRRDVIRYVHGGWIGALAAGALTWGVATYLVSISGAGRELTEGYSSLFAAVVLLSVGLWMHQKSLAGRWQRYIQERLAHLLDGRSAWVLAGLAFVVVYREVFETILFYTALWKQGNGSAMLAGLAAGAGTLAVVAVLLLRFSARLPIAKFFSISSILVAVLAVVLAGKGVAALQEAGVLQVHPVRAPRVSVLGIYPSLQTLVAQLAVLVFAVAGFAYNMRSERKQPPAT